MINNYFDKTYCINLDRRKDRWEECLLEFNKYNLKNIHRFSAIDGNTLTQGKSGFVTPSRLALILTNIKILENAIKENYRSILILEDDIEFTDEINNISEYFKFLPNDWDMLYFGGNHNQHMKIDPPKIINEKVCKLHHTFSTHCVAINQKAFTVILDRLKKQNNALDVIYVELQKSLNVYSFYPLIATQRVSFSDIENKVTDYKWLIK